MFNTLRYAKMLEEVGFSREQAETSIKILVEIMEDKLATKQDLQELKAATREDFQEFRAATQQDMQEFNLRPSGQTPFNIISEQKEDWPNLTPFV